MSTPSLEQKLQERIKELTCLYEVSSIIVNTDYDQLEPSLEAIAFCMKKAWQYSEAQVIINCNEYYVETDSDNDNLSELKADIRIFNKVEGYVIVGYPSDKYAVSDFLEEEDALIKNVAIAIGNLMERKQIGDSEAAARRQMERADRLHILGEITAGIAHELNTPLANILGFAELLKERIKDPGAVRDLEKIVDNAIFSREIVKKLMFFTCEMPQEMNTVDLIPAIESVLKLLGPSLREKRIAISRSYSNETMKLRADTVQLTQVLFNLIMNAAYFSPEGGSIGVNVVEGKKRICISISDEGEGIDPGIEDKVFEPFFTTKPIGEGSGLGLSVVHGILSSHKGSITHRPNSPRGTVFTVDFPKL